MSSAASSFSQHSELRTAANDTIAGGTSLRDGIQRFTDFLATRLDAGICRVLILGEERSALWSVAVSTPQRLDSGIRAEPEAVLALSDWPLLNHTLSGTGPVVLSWDELKTRQLLVATARQAGLAAHPRLILHLPLRAHGQPVGLLEIGAFPTDPPAFDLNATIQQLEAIMPDAAAQVDRLRLHESIEHRNKLFEDLEVASVDVRWELGQKKLRHEAVRRAVELVNWKIGAMYERRPNGEFQLVEQWPSEPHIVERVISAGQGVMGRAAAAAKAETTTGYRNLPDRELLSLDPLRLSTMAAIPLTEDGVAQSILFVAHDEPRRFLATEVEALIRFANRTALKLQTARVMREDRPLAPLLARLQRIINDFHSAPDQDRLFNRVLTAVTAAYGLQFNRAQMLLLGVGKKELLGRAGIGQFEGPKAHLSWEKARENGEDQFPAYDQLRNHPVASSEFGEWTKTVCIPFTRESCGALYDAIAEKRPVLLAEHELERLPVSYRNRIAPASPVVIVPLRSDSDAIGVLVADNAFSQVCIDQDDISLLTLCADAAGTALDSMSRLDDMRSLATTVLSGLTVPAGLGPRATLQELARQLVAALGAKWAKILLVEPCRAVSEPPQVIDFVVAGTNQLFEKERICRPAGVTSRVLDSGKPEYFGDVAAESALNPAIYQSATSAAACIPLTVSGVRVGVVWLHYSNLKEFDPAEQGVIEALIIRAAQAYEGARRADRHRRFEDAAKTLAQTIELAQLPKVIVETAASVMDSRAAVFWPHEANGFIHDGMAAWNLPESYLRQHPPRADGASERVLRDGYYPIDDMEKDGLDIPLGAGIQSSLGIRLDSGQEKLGVLYVSYFERRVFTPEDEARLKAFAVLAAASLKKSRMIHTCTHQIELADYVACNVAEHVAGMGGCKSTGLRQTLDLISSTIQNIINCRSVTLWGYTQETDTFLKPTQVGVAHPEKMETESQPSHDSVIRTILAQGERIVERTDQSDLFRATRFAQEEGIQSVFATPLVAGSGRVGVMFVNYTEPHPFTETEQLLIRRFARQAAVVIRNAQLLSDKQAQLDRQEQLGRLSTKLLESTDEKAILNEAVRIARKGLNADKSHIVTRNDINGRLALVAVDEWEKGKVGDEIPFESFAGLVIRNRQHINVLDVALERRIQVPKVAFHEEIKSLVAVPVRRGAEIIGALIVCSKTKRLFSQEEARFLELVAHQTALAVHGAREFQTSYRQNQIWSGVFNAAKAITASSVRDRAGILIEVLKHAVEQISNGRASGLVLGSIQRIENEELVFEALFSKVRLNELMVHKNRRRTLKPGEKIGITGRVAITGQAQIVNDVAEDEDYIPLLDGVRSEIAVPMIEGESVIGVLNIECEERNAFDDSDRRALEALANLTVLGQQFAALSSQFVLSMAAMSHEIRSPLGTININLTSLRPSNDDQRRVVELIRKKTSEADRLLINLADAARVQAGAVKLSWKSASLNELASKVIRELALEASAKPVQVESDLEPVMARVDAEKIEVVLRNLLWNAIKFSAQKGHIRVTLAAAGGKAVFRFWNDGPAVPLAERDKIFELFHQGGNGTKRREGGGVGLSLCREFVERHRGRVYLADDPHPGTTFVVELPLEGPGVR